MSKLVILLPMSTIESLRCVERRSRNHLDHHAHHVVVDSLDEPGLSFEVMLHQSEGHARIRSDRAK